MKQMGKSRSDSTTELSVLAERACLVARDAAFNVQDYIANSANIAFVAVKQCEKELDGIEREIDESLPAAITEVTEPEARQLLACLKFITDLERIGDLLWSVAQGIHQLPGRLPEADVHCLLEMSEILQTMLELAHRGFVERDVKLAESILQIDSKIDHACHWIFHRHLESSARKRSVESSKILLIAQAFERAGDHAKNLAEEIIYLARGHSLRHASKGRLKSE